MADPSKKIRNPLLSANVTGSTFEEFSQNAVLLPAMEKPKPIQQVPPPPLNPNTNISTTSSAFLEPIQDLDLSRPIEAFGHHQNLQQQHQQPTTAHLFPEEPITSPFQTVQPQNPQQSHLSSVFSSFSNILKINSNTSNPVENIPVSAPAGLDNLVSQKPDLNAPPVPLFSPQENILEQKTSTSNPGAPPSNSFRRSTGLKRPVYAQVPDLTNKPPVPAPQPFQNPNQPPLPPQSTLNNYFQPIQPAASPSNSIGSSISSFNDTSNNSPLHFKPISSIPPISSNGCAQISTPQFVPALNPANSNIGVNNGQFLTPTTMAAIPDVETMPGTLDGPINNVPSDFLSPTGSGQISFNQIYRPVYHHWFYRKDIEGTEIWHPFSMVDSLTLDEAFTSNDLDPDKLIATDGGRYDVNILRRQKFPVYWKGNPCEVRRCSWFHKRNTDSRHVPYEENIATMLEEQYKIAFESNSWQKRIELANGESIELHGPDTIMLFPTSQGPDAWGNTPAQSRPRTVKRGLSEFNIEEGEPAKVDHLLFMVHGIGSVCDLKFRTVEEVVEDFRSIALQLTQSHYKSSCETGAVNRVEVLPISWHQKLHSEETGIDKSLKSITLPSIPKLRDFANGTLLDILFYSSPIYCQTIVSAVANEMNRIYGMFKERNPDFNGGVSLGGHSLGSLVLFDLLSHQQEEDKPENIETENKEEDIVPPLTVDEAPLKRKISRRISYMMSKAGTGQAQIMYPTLNFKPCSLFALGSPIAMFVTVRGLDKLGEQFRLPTCTSLFNIFHPYDPVAYRIEPLINPELVNLKPVLIPHHKGRKRMHLELKETMARVGADLKQRVFDSMKSTWNTFYQLAMFHKADQPSALEEEVNKAFQDQMEEPDMTEEEPQQEQTDIPLGNLNKGRRIDYVLQESPFEIFNDYLSAITSHVCYWESEDTILLMLKEIYSSAGVSTDNQIPQQTMTIERAPPSPKSQRNQAIYQPPAKLGMDPTVPIQQTSNLAPPPTAGFFRKS